MQTHIHTDSFCLRHKIISFSICHRKTKLLFIDLYYGAFQQAPISLAQSIEIHIYIRLLCFSAFNPPRTHRLTPEELRFHIRTCSRNTRVGERGEGGRGSLLDSWNDWIVKKTTWCYNQPYYKSKSIKVNHGIKSWHINTWARKGMFTQVWNWTVIVRVRLIPWYSVQFYIKTGLYFRPLKL